ncbi:recombination-associated protein RdgC [Uliginosibacterium sp. H1]|uniref:recombination-associated protein RdgC n=1 Tax=Uliginosibacterium sp. H1 TaxID=3114757 RepID=UPI002E17BF0D|nr:recombination-associated protein RdgC [Uliginosibacterium sp. H1]
MWFRNLQIYRLEPGWKMTADQLAEQLTRLPFQPCGSQEPLSRGWIAPVADGPFAHSLGGHWLLTLMVEQRLLPGSVVKQEVAERAELLEAQQGFKPGRKQLKDLRDAVVQELMPRAFTKRRRTSGWIDPKGGWLVIDAASRKGAEPFIEALLKAADSVPVTLLDTANSPAAAMTGWLADGDGPGAFGIDQDCELRAVTDEKSAVRYVRHALDGKDVREHLGGGKQVTKLALTYDDRVSFTLNDKLEVKRLDFLDVVRDSVPDSLDQAERFDADFALMTGELSRLIPALIEALGGLQGGK